MDLRAFCTKMGNIVAIVSQLLLLNQGLRASFASIITQMFAHPLENCNSLVALQITTSASMTAFAFSRREAGKINTDSQHLSGSATLTCFWVSPFIGIRAAIALHRTSALTASLRELQ
jgi:hypothetical protein